jgi:hypothetical protein
MPLMAREGDFDDCQTHREGSQLSGLLWERSFFRVCPEAKMPLIPGLLRSLCRVDIALVQIWAWA